MNKIRLRARQFDGATLVQVVPTFRQVDGWSEASLDLPVGIVPAGLWGKVPGGDPYLLAHQRADGRTRWPAATSSSCRAGPPVQPRTPASIPRRQQSSRSCWCVRAIASVFWWPSRARTSVVELLDREHRRGQRARLAAVRLGPQPPRRPTNPSRRPRLVDDARAPRGLPAWSGHPPYASTTSAEPPTSLSSRPRGLVPLDALMTFTRCGVGTPVLTPSAGDTLAGGLLNFPVTRSVFVINNGDAWAFVGV
jgi:hypothetical protein